MINVPLNKYGIEALKKQGYKVIDVTLDNQGRPTHWVGGFFEKINPHRIDLAAVIRDDVKRIAFRLDDVNTDEKVGLMVKYVNRLTEEV